MSQQFPFILANAFFTNVRFQRDPALGETIEIEANVELKIVKEKLPKRLQLNLKFETSRDSHLQIIVELVGLFDLMDGHEEASKKTIESFINERALFILWPYFSQISTMVTSQMGMNPINWRMPPSFDFQNSDRDWMDDEEE